MQLVMLAFFTLIFLQIKLKTCGIILGHVDVFRKKSNDEELEDTHNSDIYDLRFIQNLLNKMYERANSIPHDEALRMLKLIIKKMSTYTASSQEEYWLLRQG